jgi:hypothetical protein
VLLIFLVVGVSQTLGDTMGVRFSAVFVLVIAIQTLLPTVIPVASIWMAEFQADRFALTIQPDPTILQRSLLPGTLRREPIRRLLDWFLHPPLSLRRWMTRLDDRLWLSTAHAGLFSAILLTPVLTNTINYLGLTYTHSDVTFDPVSGLTGYMIHALYVQFTAALGWIFAAGTLLALWPRVASRWERLFGQVPIELSPLSVTQRQLYRTWAIALLALSASGAVLVGVWGDQIEQHLPQSFNPTRIALIGRWQVVDQPMMQREFRQDGIGAMIVMLPAGAPPIRTTGSFAFADDHHLLLTPAEGSPVTVRFAVAGDRLQLWFGSAAYEELTRVPDL